MSFLPSFFSKEPSVGDHFVALDIGSDSAKVGVFELREGIPYLTGFSKSSYRSEAISSGVITDMNIVAEVVRESLEEAYTASNSRPKKTIVGLSGELCKGFTTVVRLTRSFPEKPLSDKELVEVQDKVEEASFVRAEEEFSLATGDSKISIEIVSSKITDFKIDGQSVTDPSGLLGSTLDVYYYAAFCTSSYIAQIQSVLKRLNLKMVTTVSLMFSLIESLAVQKDSEFNAIVVDVGGDVTDISVVFGGGIVATKSLALGGRTVTRAIAKEWDCSLSDAEELKGEYVDKMMESEEISRIKKAIEPVMKLWVAGFGFVLGDFNSVKTFPSMLYITGGGALVPDLKDSLFSSPWSRGLHFVSFPKVVMVHQKDMVYINDATDGNLGLDELSCFSLGLTGSQIGGHHE